MLAGLDETGDLQEMDADQERLYDALFLSASNEGDFYRKKDAKGAVEKAFRDYMRSRELDLRHDFKTIKAKLVKDLARRWKVKSEGLEESKSHASIGHVEKVNNYLDFVEKQLKEARHSTGLLLKNPQKYAPQLDNLMNALREIQKTARVALKWADEA